MKRISLILIFAVALLVPPARGQDNEIGDPETDKRAQTGFKFLSVSTDPRAAALGDAITAFDVGSAMSLFYNPAAMAYQVGTFNLAASQTQFIAEIDYNSFAASFAPMGGTYGVFGVSFVAVDYGTFIGTVRTDGNDQGYVEFDEIGLANPSPTAFALGVGYARALTDRFSVGGHVRYAKQDLGEAIKSGTQGDYLMDDLSMNTVAVDFGVLYRTGFRSLVFAMDVRNFSKELQYVEENFELPLTFRIGVAMDLIDLTSLNPNTHSFKLGIDAERPRDFDENLRLGAEYTIMNTLSLRAGYSMPTDEQGVSLGAGLQQSFGGFGFGADYAYTTFGDFDAVHRMALRISF